MLDQQNCFKEMAEAISIPVAANRSVFINQISLFWESHQALYGDSARQKAHLIFVEQERNLSFPSVSMPHTKVKDWFEFFPRTEKEFGLSPLNMQVGLKQVLHMFDDDQLIEFLDCDMFHFKKMPDLDVKPNELVTCDFYENWHLHSLSKYKYIVEPLLTSVGTYNGGFVPIVGHAGTFKKIVDDWIEAHLKLYDSVQRHDLRWWCGMFALQVACSNQKVNMRAEDTCYIPVQNKISNNHYIGHYSCDPYFDKNKIADDLGRLSTNNFPNNKYYSTIKNWRLNHTPKTGTLMQL